MVRTAIATVFDGSPSYACALPLWCQQAAELSSQLRNSSLLLLTRNASASADCPGARLLWDWRAQAVAVAMRAYFERQPIRGSWRSLKTAALLKLACIGMAEFDLILFADLDVRTTSNKEPLTSLSTSLSIQPLPRFSFSQLELETSGFERTCFLR